MPRRHIRARFRENRYFGGAVMAWRLRLRDVGDSVLYHAQSWAANPQQVWVRYGDQSLVWIAAARNALNDIPRPWRVSEDQSYSFK
jgi:hypothetical protein